MGEMADWTIDQGIQAMAEGEDMEVDIIIKCMKCVKETTMGLAEEKERWNLDDFYPETMCHECFLKEKK